MHIDRYLDLDKLLSSSRATIGEVDESSEADKKVPGMSHVSPDRGDVPLDLVTMGSSAEIAGTLH
jgi:hypothetical protein